MTRRRRRTRFYLRGHVGCLGCSIPIGLFGLAVLGAIAAVIL